MTPKAVLMKTDIKSLNTARPVNTAHPKTTVYSARPMSCFSKLAQSTIKRPYQSRTALTNKKFNQKVNTTKEKVYTVKPKAVNTARSTSAVVNAVRANLVNDVKASTCWGHLQKEDQGYFDSGCSRHMTCNMSYLSDFKEFDGGYVTFGGGARGGRFTGKGTLKTENSVLFTDTACFVLSPDFKLPDEIQVSLKVPRKNNMYSVDMKDIVPKESLTCLVAKATLDESMLWHKGLGHINFKTINKLVKDNLVRGLPAKGFENDQTCVACLKGKQHKVSCKSKIQISITQPLFMLHMDLFGPTFVSSLMNKKYCLVVTDDYGRFTWVFFLASKDKTSGILKKFITEIENLVDKKVKIIRCDNGTEFNNRVMNEFCKKKGIKREFSVAERRNRTLIKAARTMLADCKLPTIFFAEAINTACYVQNRVIIVKPHNKTPYELFRGRTPALSFMRPFECHVTILNTLDHLGKFDGKSDDGNGPKWLFDIDSLTKSMNYVPVVAGTNSNDFAGLEECNGAGHTSKETEFSQDYIVMPLWKDGSMFDSSSKNSSDDEPQPSSKADEGVSKASGFSDQDLNINTVSPTVITTRSNRSQNVSGTFSLGRSATLEATHADLFGDETEMDMSNLTTSYQVPTTPNTRIHRDHSLDHVIGDIQYGVQTRGMTKNTNEHGFISVVYEEKTHEDLHTCLFAYFLSQEEPKRITKALSDPALVEATQEELLQFKLQKGYTQEEGIDYDEVFALVARIKAIRLFLAYASFMGFMVYQMDVKSAFCYGIIEEELYVCQPPRFEDPDYPDKVYKVVKALYGLHQAPRVWYGTLAKYLLNNGFQRGKIDQTLFIKKQKGDILLVQVYVDDIIFGSTNKELCTEFQKLMHDKFQMSSIGELNFFLASTLMDTEKPLLKDSDGDDVDVHLYRSVIGSLMYLTSSRPDIMFACKNQIVGATSSTEAEYVAAASCCGQARHIEYMDTKIPQASGPPKKVDNEAVHKELGDRMERAATTASSLGAEQDSGNINRTQSMATLNEPSPYGTSSVNTLGSGKDSMKLMELMEHCTKLSELFWQTASASTLENGNIELTATIDGKVKIVSEVSIRRNLKLEDSDGSTIPVESHHTPINALSTSQPPTSPPSMQTTHVAEEAANMPHDSPLPGVASLEADLKQTKKIYGNAYTKLIMKVKKLEHKIKSSKSRRRAKIVISDDEDCQEDPSKHGRKISQINEDEGITLVQMSAHTQGRHEHDFEEPNFEFTAPEEVYTGKPDISTAGPEVSTASPEDRTAAESLVYIRRSATKRKDKDKAIMKEAEPVQKKTKLQLEQERLGL
ncbi:putative ribonuclease H-like domain-containing protein [Tanacetum coccineum]